MSYQLHHGDCLAILPTLEDCSVDAIVDIARAKRFYIMLPKLDYRMTKRSGELQFPCPPASSTFLDFMYWTIGVKPRIRMPKSTVYLDGNISGRDEEIVDTNESSFVVSDCVLSNVLDAESIKNRHYRILKLRASRNPVFGYRKAASLAGFFPLLFGFLVGSGRDAFQPSLLSSNPPCLPAFFGYHVWIHNNPFAFTKRPTGVVASPRAKYRSVLTLDCRRCFTKRLSASCAREVDLLTQGSCPKGIGARSRASGLPAVLKSLRIGVVRPVAGWTGSVWFHARIVAFFLVLSMALMQKQWDDIELRTGSGSTGKAAIIEDFKFIGIEREAEYIEIARARLDAAVKFRSGFLF